MRPIPNRNPSRRTASQLRVPGLILAIAGVLGLFPALFPGAAVAGEPVETKFWGRSVMLVAYDTADLRAGLDFGSYVVTDGPARVNFNPRDTRLGMSAAQTKGEWTYKSCLELDFYGDNAGNNLLPRLRLGYAEAAHKNGFSLRAGQDWIPVAQQNAGTLDFGVLAWGGNLWWRVPQITVRKKTAGAELLVGVMKHRISGTQEAEETMPWVMGRVAATGLQGGKGLLAIGGGFRSNSLTDTVDETAVETDYGAWLVCGEWKLALGPRFTLTGEAWTGEGLGREFVRYDLDYNRQALRSIQASGGFANVAIDLGRGAQLNLGAGLDDPDDDDAAGSTAVPFVKNQVVYGNLKWQATEHFGAGVEAMDFATDTLGGAELSGQRFTMGTWFTF